MYFLSNIKSKCASFPITFTKGHLWKWQMAINDGTTNSKCLAIVSRLLMPISATCTAFFIKLPKQSSPLWGDSRCFVHTIRYTVGPLLVINGATTTTSRYSKPQLPIYKAIHRGYNSTYSW